MQTLILATSIFLSAPTAPITTFSTAQDLHNDIQSQVSLVSNTVLNNAAISAKDTFLYQAKHAIATASNDVEISISYELAAE